MFFVEMYVGLIGFCLLLSVLLFIRNIVRVARGTHQFTSHADRRARTDRLNRMRIINDANQQAANRIRQM